MLFKCNLHVILLSIVCFQILKYDFSYLNYLVKYWHFILITQEVTGKLLCGYSSFLSVFVIKYLDKRPLVGKSLLQFPTPFLRGSQSQELEAASHSISSVKGRKKKYMHTYYYLAYFSHSYTIKGPAQEIMLPTFKVDLSTSINH